jgi:single-stranded DNA-binding protein
MQNINQWIGEGNISCTPELRYTFDKSKAVTNFNLYVDNSYKSKSTSEDSTFIKHTIRVPVVAWVGRANHIVKNFQKGDKVRLMGHLRTKEVIINEKKVLTFEIVAKNIYLIHRVSKNFD